MHKFHHYQKRMSARPAIMFVALALAAAPLPHNGTANAQIASSTDALSMEAPAARMSAGHTVVANWTAQPPALTGAAIAAMQAAFARSHRSGPTNLPTAALAAGGQSGPGPEQNLANEEAAAPSDFVLVDRIVGTGNGLRSAVGEPSSDNAGADIFQSGNWYATRSTDRGATWTFVNPFTMFGAGFCCDQVVV